MGQRRGLATFLAVSLLANAFCIPADLYRLRRHLADNEVRFNSRGQLVSANSGDTIRVARQDNAAKINEITKTGTNVTQKASLDPSSTLPPAPDDYEAKKNEYQTPEPYEDDDDDDDFYEPMDVAQTNNGGGISIFSLINLISALFPGSSGTNVILTNIIREFLRNQGYGFARRQDVDDNEIDIDYIQDLKPPPFQRQETEEDTESEASESDSVQEENSEEDDNAAEEIDDVDNGNDKDNGNGKIPQENSDSNENGNDSDYDSDEPPGGGDGQGGGLLGLLAGLSGGEDGQSDLGSLLATVGGIVANLSGDGFDLNAILASGIGLFVGLLSEGEENPGAVIASFLLTSLDTITGGGSNNNGAFFGSLISKLVKGTSAAQDPDGSSEENGNGMQMKDSTGFFASFLMALLGDMSKGSSAGSSH